MKKKQVLTLLLTGCLMLTACNSSPNTSSSNPNTVNETTNADTANTDATNEDAGTLTNETAQQTETSDKHTDENESQQAPVTITYEMDEQEFKADNDDIIFSYSLSYPVVSIPDNAQAQDVIDASLQEQKKEIETEVETQKEDATEYYEMAKNDEYYTESYAYYDYSALRADEGIISFKRQDYFYMGGAHGQGVFTNYNYDARTGKLLTLDDIFVDPAAAREELLAKLTVDASNPYYRELMYQDVDADLSCLLDEGDWYLDKGGLFFMSQTYELGPYASGPITFIIPYEKLPELKEDYKYNTYLLHTSLVGETITTWLDGDDEADTILYEVINPLASNGDMDESGETIESEVTTEAVEMTFTLKINGKDFSQEFIDSVGYISDNYSIQYYVVDIDQNDNYKELAIVDYDYSDNNKTHFFRYENESLKYLGTISDAPDNESFYINGDGTVNGRIYSNLLQTTTFQTVYALNGDTIAPVETDWYEVDDSLWGETDRHHNILKEVTVYKEANLESETITLTPEDGKVRFPATDNENWYQIETTDGKIYYLYMTDFLTVPNGGTDMDATEIFENLFLVG